MVGNQGPKQLWLDTITCVGPIATYEDIIRTSLNADAYLSDVLKSPPCICIDCCEPGIPGGCRDSPWITEAFARRQLAMLDLEAASIGEPHYTLMGESIYRIGDFPLAW